MQSKTAFLEQGATFSDDGLYRYNLWRRWDGKSSRKVTFVMLNPSTANAEKFDPTVRRCFGYARDWGFGSMEVVNLFAYRSTYPALLKKAEDPVGPGNDAAILKAVKGSDLVMAAWGAHGSLRARDAEALRLITEVSDLYCLGKTGAGHPLHPLHQPKCRKPVPFANVR